MRILAYDQLSFNNVPILLIALPKDAYLIATTVRLQVFFVKMLMKVDHSGAPHTRKEMPSAGPTDEYAAWAWNINDKSSQVQLLQDNGRTVLFHPKWSNGTAAIRADRPLSSAGVTYWVFF